MCSLLGSCLNTLNAQTILIWPFLRAVSFPRSFFLRLPRPTCRPPLSNPFVLDPNLSALGSVSSTSGPRHLNAPFFRQSGKRSPSSGRSCRSQMRNLLTLRHPIKGKASLMCPVLQRGSTFTKSQIEPCSNLLHAFRWHRSPAASRSVSITNCAHGEPVVSFKAQSAP